MTEIAKRVYRADFRPTEKQAAVLDAHAAYAERARRWVFEHPADERTSVKKLYTAFKSSDLFDETLSGTVAERAIAAVVDGVEPPAGACFNAADAARHGSKHVKVEDAREVQRLRLPKAGGVELAGEWISTDGLTVREAWIGRTDEGAWWVELVVAARVLVRTVKVRMRPTKAQRKTLAALARRADAVWNAVGVVVWAAGVKLPGKDAETRAALVAQLEAKLADRPVAARAAARAVFGEGRERPYADTTMTKGWSRDEAFVVDDAHRLQQAVINEVAAQYRTSQGRKLDHAKERQRMRTEQRKRDGEVKAGRRLAAAYARTGAVDPDLLEGLAQALKARPAPHRPKPAEFVLLERDGAPEVTCPVAGCTAVFARTRARCPECGHRRQPDAIGGKSRWSTTRSTGFIPLRGDMFELDWNEGAFEVRLVGLGGMRVALDEPERLAGRIVRAAKVTEDVTGHWYLSVSCEEPVHRPAGYADAIGVNVGLREMVTTSRGEHFVMPRYRARDAEHYAKLQGARVGKARKAGRAAGGRNQPKLRRLAMRQASKRRQRHCEIARALLGMPTRKHTEAPLGRAAEGKGVAFTPPRVIYVGSWRPATEGRGDKWQFADGRDQAVAAFVRVLAEQAERVGSRVVNTAEAFTTITCSACGAERYAPVPKGVFEWECEECETVHNRYVNAACNILSRGLATDAGTLTL